MRANHEQRCEQMRQRLKGGTLSKPRQRRGRQNRSRPITAEAYAQLIDTVQLRINVRAWCSRNCDNINGIHHMACPSLMWDESDRLRPPDTTLDRVNA